MHLLNMHAFKYRHRSKALHDPKATNLVDDYMEKVEKIQDCYEATHQLTIDQLNFIHINLTNSQKMMHELLAIVKQQQPTRKFLLIVRLS